VRDPVPAVLDQLVRLIGASGGRVGELDDGLDVFADVVVGDADNGDIEDGRVAGHEVSASCG